MINLQNSEMTKKKKTQITYVRDIYYFIFKVPLDSMIVLHHLKMSDYITIWAHKKSI
jgi:hypothetical protein